MSYFAVIIFTIVNLATHTRTREHHLLPQVQPNKTFKRFFLRGDWDEPEWPTGNLVEASGPAALNEEPELQKTTGHPTQDRNLACGETLH